jgi:hypothetical protein
VGNNVDVTYDPAKPTEIAFKQPSKITFGLISIACALLIIVVSYINYYMTSQSKMFAATEGAKSVLSIL